ncbi:MAG TPA: sugar transporter [Nitrospiraceae bacterium]|jgi:polysaccharide export outer membrane protein|nr:sugar transporter [Nitrospiraceae bacterium]
MLRKILLLLIAWTLAVSSPALSRADEGGGAAPPEKTPSVSGETVSHVTSPPVIPPNAEHYLIGPGDVLDISVWKDESLTRSCVVLPDGFITFPLVGSVAAAGRTVEQLKSDLEERLTRYVPQVALSLEVKQINSLIIYVIGRVNTPGRYILNVDIDVLQALATAGGLNPFANRNKIKIFRQGSEETTMYPFEYDEVVQGKRLEQNIYLRRGDVVVVP